MISAGLRQFSVNGFCSTEKIVTLIPLLILRKCYQILGVFIIIIIIIIIIIALCFLFFRRN
jgi:hypothetical protein